MQPEIYAIHSASEELKDKMRNITHHYTDVFTTELLAPLTDKVYVGNTEYEVDKSHRVLIKSYDGKLALWQNAPTFASKNNYTAGDRILNSSGEIVSIITGSKLGRYAISCFDGYTGKFESSRDWLMVNGSSGIIYGNKTFKSREELREYLQGRTLGENVDLQPIIVDAPIPRVILFDLCSGLEISHSYMRGEFEVRVCDKYH